MTWGSCCKEHTNPINKKTEAERNNVKCIGWWKNKWRNPSSPSHHWITQQDDSCYGIFYPFKGCVSGWDVFICLSAPQDCLTLKHHLFSVWGSLLLPSAGTNTGIMINFLHSYSISGEKNKAKKGCIYYSPIRTFYILGKQRYNCVYHKRYIKPRCFYFFWGDACASYNWLENSILQ